MKLMRLILWIQLTVTVFCSFHNEKTKSGSQVFDRNTDKETEPSLDDKPTHPCGSQVCRCWNYVANCSRVPGGLQHIPPLPDEIRYLYFSYNHLKSIPANFFQNVTKLIKVDVSHNNLAFISPDAFRPLRKLRYLFLSANTDLTYKSLSPAFRISSLEELDIMSCSLGPLPADLFHNTTLPRLRSLYLHDNDVGNLALSTFKPLTALKELGLPTNDISVMYSDSVIGVEKINLDSNTMYQFPKTCNGTSSFFPHLRALLLQGNRLSAIPQTVCLPRLQVIVLGENKFSRIETGSFSAQKFPRLLQVSLVQMDTLISVIGKDAFANPTLYRIDLAYNSIKFSSQGIHNDSFAGCPRLYILELGHNKMDVDEGRFVRLFGNLSSVSFVDMQDSKLRQLTPRMLSGFRNLTRLHLNRNLLISLSDGLFDNLTHLRYVDLCQNQLRDIQPTLFSKVTRDRLKSLDLSGNPFSCNCDLLWFQDWLKSNDSLFNNSWTTYECHNKPNESVQHFFLAQQACVWNQSTYIIVDVVIGLLIVIFVVIFGLVRYRWHLRLLVYEAFRGQGEARRRHLQNNHFEYDVYVVYDLSDEVWVRKNLVPQLEERLQLRLCLQERNLDPTRPELSTISDCVEKSKKFLMLFSANFVQNQLCQFQLSLCLQHVLDHEDALVIACLDDVAPRDMTAAMISVLRTTPYIQWAEGVDAVASFWGRLRIAMEEVI